MSSDHQRKKSLREYQHHLPTSHFSGLNLPVRTASPPPCWKTLLPSLRLWGHLRLSYHLFTFHPGYHRGGGVDFHHGSHSDDASDALPIGNRDPEKTSTNWIGKTLHTRHKFRQITTMHLLKTFYVQLIKFIHAISCSSINKISIFPLIFSSPQNPTTINESTQTNRVLVGVQIFTSSPMGSPPRALHATADISRSAMRVAEPEIFAHRDDGFGWLLAGLKISWISLNITFSEFWSLNILEYLSEFWKEVSF